VHCLPFLGMGSDAADGSLYLEDDALDLAWSHRQSRRMFESMEGSMRAIAEASGGRWSLTTAAVAERAAHWMLHGRDRTIV
jgi:hypothetical protein